MTIPEFIDQIHELILWVSRIADKSILQQLGVSRERVGFIILEDLELRKLSPKVGLKYAWKRNKYVNHDISLRKIWISFGKIQMISWRVW